MSKQIPCACISSVEKNSVKHFQGSIIDKVFSDDTDRSGLQVLLDYAGESNELIADKMDRLIRNLDKWLPLVNKLIASQIHFLNENSSIVEKDTPMSKFLSSMITVLKHSDKKEQMPSSTIPLCKQNYLKMDKIVLFLDCVLESIKDFPDLFSASMAELFLVLLIIRDKFSDKDWKLFCYEIAQHPIKEILHQDPFSKRAFEKPRGYAGDAVMLDYLYAGFISDIKTVSLDEITELGKKIHNLTINIPDSLGVMERARCIGRTIDSIYEHNPDMRILSIAAGHLREPRFSDAFNKGLIKEVVAFDQDEDSLRLIREEYKDKNVSTVKGKIKDLFIETKLVKSLGMFDFIFASGLFDYLNDRPAILLTRSMFSLLKPQGKMYITNFIDNNLSQGYMETFMGWTLIYRTLEEIEVLSESLDSSHIRSKRTFTDKTGSIGFLEIEKK